MGKAEKPVEGNKGQPESVKFSIIVPVYNAARYLEEAVSSIVRQDYERVELLLVDDGSTDGSGALCEKLAREDKRIRVFHQENQGQIGARERGITEAAGDYLLFLDADDSLEAGALRILASAIRHEEPDILLFNGYEEQEGHVRLLWPEEEDGILDADVFRRKAVESRRYNQIWLKAFRRGLITGKRVSMEGRAVRSEEDLLMQLPWFSEAKKIARIPDKLYRYRVNPDSITHHLEKNKPSDALYLHGKLYYYALAFRCPEARKACNTRFLEDVITYVKQALQEKERFGLLHELAEKEEIWDIFAEKQDNLTGKQRLFLHLIRFLRFPKKKDLKKVLFRLLRNRRSIMRHPDQVDGVSLEWWDYRLNVGDTLSPVIVRWAKEKRDKEQRKEDEEKERQVAGGRLLALGSLLGMEAYDATVWGSGIHTDLSASAIFRNRRRTVLCCKAVRGPVTEAILNEAGYETSGVWGDPGILMPWIYPRKEALRDGEEKAGKDAFPNREEKAGQEGAGALMPKQAEKVLLIRHYIQAEDLPQGLPVSCLDVGTDDYKGTIQRIVAVDKVISSSLHGLILAECYGIPAIFLRQGMDREEIKYLDWYRSTGRETYPAADSVAEALTMEPAPLPKEEKLEEMREKLLLAFPKELF